MPGFLNLSSRSVSEMKIFLSESLCPRESVRDNPGLIIFPKFPLSSDVIFIRLPVNAVKEPETISMTYLGGTAEN